MEKTAVFLLLMGTILFIGFGMVVSNSYEGDVEFSDFCLFDKIRVSISTFLCLLGLLLILTALVLGISYVI